MTQNLCAIIQKAEIDQCLLIQQLRLIQRKVDKVRKKRKSYKSLIQVPPNSPQLHCTRQSPSFPYQFPSSVHQDLCLRINTTLLLRIDLRSLILNVSMNHWIYLSEATFFFLTLSTLENAKILPDSLPFLALLHLCHFLGSGRCSSIDCDSQTSAV